MTCCTSVQSEHTKGSTCSKTVLVEVRAIGTKDALKCYCIIDEQSNTSLVDPYIITNLNINPPESSYSIITVDGVKSNVKGHLVSGLEVRGINENQWIRLPNLFSNSFIPDTKFEIATSDIVRDHPHVSHLAKHFPNEVSNYDVLLLVGSNCGPAMSTRPYGTHAPYVHHTSLGWAMVGPICKDISNDYVVVLRTGVCSDHYDAELNFDSNKPCNFNIDHECIGDEMLGLSKNDQKFNQVMNNSVSLTEAGNLQMDLPLKETVSFPDNKAAVFNRTFNTLNRLRKEYVKLNQCISVMDKYILAGHVKQIHTEESITGMVWYLPVFPVSHPRKKKCRLVFDSSATYQGVSLNDQLYQGPDNNNLLLGVLMRFRVGEIGFSCDIENMFHCFYVSPVHRDCLRFFWYADNDPTNHIVLFQALVHVFGNCCSPAVANYGLRYAAQHSPHLSAPKSVDFINRCMYVDDGLGSSSTEDEAIATLTGARDLLSPYNIRLHKIVSSSPAVMQSFPSSEIAEEAKIIFSSESGSSSTLGIVWQLGLDRLTLRHEFTEKPFTKRGILSANGANFDPLGVSSPVTLGGRLFQRMVLPPKSNTTNRWADFNWDDPLPPEYREQWHSWIKGLSDLNKIEIPRGYVPLGFGKITGQVIHIFSDASKDAMAYVCYVQSFNEEGHINNCFLLANSKVAPKMANSIPRMELCAAVEASLAARKISVELNFPIEDIKFYTDSKVLLGYLSNDEKQFKRYVTRRIETILNCSSRHQWHYIPTSLNPADIGTKPHTPDELVKTIWLRGPDFLQYNSELSVDSVTNPCLNLPEEVEVKQVLSTKVVTAGTSNESVGFVICNRTSSWNTAIVIMRTALKLLGVLDQARQRLGISTTERNPTQTMSVAIEKLVTNAQIDSFHEEIIMLTKNGHLPDKNKLAALTPFIDQHGLLRVGGRIDKANISYHLKHPVILPREHPVTQLILHNVHHKTMHSGRHITHGALRNSGYYITGGLRSIRSLVKNCFLCRVLRAPFQNQFMSDLPADRLEETPPFCNVGIDVFGPYYIHDGITTRRTNSSRKLWGLLFTCLSSRAVHIEPLCQMDTNSFRNSLRRFWAVRGTCRRIRSDRGTNFLGAKNQMENEVDLNNLRKLANSNNIEWEFTTPGASSHGGVWERKVGAVKTAMSSSLRQLNNRLLSRDEMTTLFQEGCSIVNNTPLWDFSPHPNKCAPLSPAMLLTLRDAPNPPAAESFTENDLLQYGGRRWRRVQYLAEQFWCSWRNHHLNTLQLRYKWKIKNRNVNIGDIVLLKGKSKRNNWPIGVVTDMKKSRDGLVRSVAIRLPGEPPRLLERALFDTILLIPNKNRYTSD